MSARQWVFATSWRLVELPEWPSGLDVTLTVDTQAVAVVEAIERAAANAGIELHRVEDE